VNVIAKASTNATIAFWNRGSGRSNQLTSLGPQALPAIDKAIELLAKSRESDLSARGYCLVSRLSQFCRQSAHRIAAGR
ncbi:hypothetical protein ONI95_22985, partial [Salmonella enterica subsp. enterica serovar Newport]|nr:hypothetical protein [Salmonella enterica subsp. enterica serovar Newport]